MPLKFLPNSVLGYDLKRPVGFFLSNHYDENVPEKWKITWEPSIYFGRLKRTIPNNFVSFDFQFQFLVLLKPIIDGIQNTCHQTTIIVKLKVQQRPNTIMDRKIERNSTR